MTDARDVWLLMSDLVLDNTRRRQVSESTGLSFGRIRAIRRLAREPLSMGELADAMGIDRPNATTLVAGLEADGLVRRRPHPTDGRAKLVATTAKGKKLAEKADAILATPPAGLTDLSPDDLTTLQGILASVSSGGHGGRRPA
jgi:DNA-binding MarR family transcriptional regulator